MLDRRSGLITTKGSLHGVVGSYKLLIEATDHYGTTSVATLMLRVASSSQCLPRFISPNSDGVIVEIDQV